jgi:Protein of unknown function (DUF1036)
MKYFSFYLTAILLLILFTGCQSTETNSSTVGNIENALVNHQENHTFINGEWLENRTKGYVFLPDSTGFRLKDNQKNVFYWYISSDTIFMEFVSEGNKIFLLDTFQDNNQNAIKLSSLNDLIMQNQNGSPVSIKLIKCDSIENVIKHNLKEDIALKEHESVKQAEGSGIEKENNNISSTVLPELCLWGDCIEIENITSEKIWFSIAYFDRVECSCWHSVGWYHILPQNKIKIKLKNEVPWVYLNVQSNTRNWKGDYLFCIDDVNAFELNVKKGQDYTCKKRDGFFKIDRPKNSSGSYVNDWKHIITTSGSSPKHTPTKTLPENKPDPAIALGNLLRQVFFSESGNSSDSDQNYRTCWKCTGSGVNTMTTNSVGYDFRDGWKKISPWDDKVERTCTECNGKGKLKN